MDLQVFHDINQENGVKMKSYSDRICLILSGFIPEKFLPHG